MDTVKASWSGSELERLVSQVKLIGEGADDAGGVFDDTITEMCQELKTGVVSLILTTPNARNETGYNRDRRVQTTENLYFLSTACVDVEKVVAELGR